MHHAGVREMKHRRGMQIDGIVDSGRLRQGVASAVEEILVAQHHAFRAAGGAAGVEDAGQVPSGRVSVRDRRGRGDDRLVIDGVRRQRRGRRVVGVDEPDRPDPVG